MKNERRYKISSKLLVFVVEDNKIYQKMVCESLKRGGVENLKAFESGADCIAAVEAGAKPNAIIQDYHLGDTNGLDILLSVKEKLPRTQFVFLTANEDLEVAVNSIKYGAFDYITKDNEMALKKVVNKIEKISELYELHNRNNLATLAIIVNILILIGIIVFAVLHTFFDTFGLR